MRGVVKRASIEVARADHNVCVASLNWSQDRCDLRWVMLAIAVDLYCHIKTPVAGVEETRLHGTANAEVEWERKYYCSAGRRDNDGVVVGAVIDDRYNEGRLVIGELANDSSNRFALVECRNDRKSAGRLWGYIRGQLNTGARLTWASASSSSSPMRIELMPEYADAIAPGPFCHVSNTLASPRRPGRGRHSHLSGHTRRTNLLNARR